MSFQTLSDRLMFGKVKFYYLLPYVVGTLVQKWLQGMVYHSLCHYYYRSYMVEDMNESDDEAILAGSEPN